MKKLSAILLTGAFALGAATVGDAQIRTGTQETGFSGALVDNDDRFWNVSGFYGYFYNENLQFLGIGDLQGGSDQSTRGSIGPGVDWHFTGVATDAFVPYAGGSYLIGIGSGVPDALEGHVGIKQFVARSVAVKYQVGYGFDPSETSDSSFRASVGLSFFF